MICTTRSLSMYCAHWLRRTYCNCIRFVLANAFVEQKAGRTFSWKNVVHFLETRCIPWCNIIYNYMHIKCISVFFLHCILLALFFFHLDFTFFWIKENIAWEHQRLRMYNAFIGNVPLERMLTSVDIYISSVYYSSSGNNKNKKNSKYSTIWGKNWVQWNWNCNQGIH